MGSMATEFSLTFPANVVCGNGYASDAQFGRRVAALGTRALIVSGASAKRNGLVTAMRESLESAGVDVQIAHPDVPPEPTLEDCRRAMACAAEPDVVIGVGGGSALDVAKAAALAPFGIDPARFLSGELPVPSTGALPIVAVPTTSGTGSEATWVGVYTDDSGSRKASFRGTAMMPSLVVLDPATTVSCSPAVTAHSGLDALVQALESRVARGANPMTNALSEAAALRIADALPRAWSAGTDLDARYEMLVGSTMAGIALNSSRLGLVHGLAHPVGVRSKAPHGLVCGMLFPSVLRFNLPVCASQLSTIAATLARPGNPAGLPAWFESLLNELEVPTRLRDIGIAETDLVAIAEDSLGSGSTAANPRAVALDDAIAVLRDCW